MKIIFVHNSTWDYCETVKVFANSIVKFSKHEIHLVKHETMWLNKITIPEDIINSYDVICFNYTSWQNINMSELANKNIKKVLILQDEYHYSKEKKNIINKFDLIFTNILEKDAKIIFNKEKIYKTILTGYVCDSIKKISIKEKKINIFYRGRTLPYIYGQLGYDKIFIGKQMKKICNHIGLSYNIEWDEKDRIYGDEWIKILGNSKVTLATESGCRIFDDGTIKNKINKKIEENPNYTFKQAKTDFNFDNIKKYRACEISPKMFEAIALGTVLVMYPGKYKNILIPNVHYIELKRDYSNIYDVLKKIKDDDFLQKMADVVYKDIVESGKYSYKSFVEEFDKVINTSFSNINKSQ